MNTYAQNSKESLKWRIKNDDNTCLAEIQIGNLKASASRNNKRQSKLYAAKNLLKTIDSNTFLKTKFFYFLHDMKERVEPQKQVYMPKNSYQNDLDEMEASEREEMEDNSHEAIHHSENADDSGHPNIHGQSFGEGFEDFEVVWNDQG